MRKAQKSIQSIKNKIDKWKPKKEKEKETGATNSTNMNKCSLTVIPQYNQQFSNFGDQYQTVSA